MTTSVNHKTERLNDLDKIKSSAHPRKVVVAGPGTGKSFLFSKLIEDRRKKGGTKFLAITFVGKLGDALADDLCGLAETKTMHGFVRQFFLEQCGNGWVYYPTIFDVIKEDLEQEGVVKFEIGDENYKKKTLRYKAVGDADVVYYAVQICKKNENKIPLFDLILIDEFQDFNEIESEFVDQLAKKNQIVIVGDDDQVLYEFKGSSPRFIRDKHDSDNKDWDSHTLRFCSRCTEVMIKYFHALVEKYNLNNTMELEVGKRRINKEYICYAPENEHDSKIHDSQANSKIHLIKNCPVGMIAYKIKSELRCLSENQKIKDVLVIGEAQSCKSLLHDVAVMLRDYGFKNVTYADKNLIDLNYTILDAYKLIQQDENSPLGWRLLGSLKDGEKSEHQKRVKTLKKILKRESVADSSVAKLIEGIDTTEKTDAEIKKLMVLQDIKKYFKTQPRPLSNFDITICNILNSKGLGADVVFVVGFDQGRLPKTTTPEKSEVYQMLVALTRAKKRIYFINSVGKSVSTFIKCLPMDLLAEETIKS